MHYIHTYETLLKISKLRRLGWDFSIAPDRIGQWTNVAMDKL